MKHYREKLKIDTIINAVTAAILAAAFILSLLNEFGPTQFFTPAAGDSHWHSRWNGFICGASVGLLGMMVFFILRNLKALRDEKALKKLYVKDNDERTAQIIASAQAAAYRTCLLVGLVAVVTAGCFSITVSLTILASLTIAALLGCVYNIYYSRKF